VSSFYGYSTIGYYLDEAAYVIPNRNYAPVSRTFDVDRVEVLRGPQGTLFFGLGSMGCTIRFITADPDLIRFRVRGDAGYSFTAENAKRQLMWRSGPQRAAHRRPARGSGSGKLREER